MALEQSFLDNPDIKDCCKQEDNLVLHSVRDQETGKLRDDLFVRICKECNCRHWEATADPFELGFTGAPMGGPS